MLPVVVPSRNSKPGLGPDDLTPQFIATPLQRFLNLAAEETRMPDIDDRSWKQAVGGGPIHLVVVCNLALATRGERNLAFSRGLVAPRWVVADPVGWVRRQQ